MAITGWAGKAGKAGAGPTEVAGRSLAIFRSPGSMYIDLETQHPYPVPFHTPYWPAAYQL